MYWPNWSKRMLTIRRWKWTWGRQYEKKGQVSLFEVSLFFLCNNEYNRKVLSLWNILKFIWMRGSISEHGEDSFWSQVLKNFKQCVCVCSSFKFSVRNEQLMCWTFRANVKAPQVLPYFCAVLVSNMMVTSPCWHWFCNSDHPFTGSYPGCESTCLPACQWCATPDTWTFPWVSRGPLNSGCTSLTVSEVW